MQLGEFQLSTVSGGRFRSDGGTMFGVVPKVLWSRVFPADDQNCIAQATNCVLVRTPNQNVLIDTGYGSKLTAKQRAVHVAEEGDPLLASLTDAGVSADEIDVVILSHLHFDHAGGATRFDDEGTLVPTFPNAEYVVQRIEWDTATADFPELRNAYPQDNLLPLKESGRLRLIEGDVEIVDGIRALVTGGHTEGHAALVIESEQETAVYLGDLCPTTRHFHSLWGMSYDVDPLQMRRVKPRLLGEIADNGWLALFDHDPDYVAATLARDQRREFVVEQAHVAL